MSTNSFGARATLKAGKRSYEIFRLDALERGGLSVARLPYSLKILLENLLRLEDGRVVRREDIEKLSRWEPLKLPDEEIAFMPARVLLQDFTGVPAVVDLAAMRDAIVQMGGDPKRVNPLLPAELVIDHVPSQRRPRVPTQPRALCVAALGAEDVCWVQGRAA